MTISTDTDRRIDRLAGDIPVGSIASSASGAAKVYYISDANGDDTNDGSLLKPLKTITRFEALLPDVIKHEISAIVEPHTGDGYAWPTFRPRTGSKKIWVQFPEVTVLATGTADASSISSLVDSGFTADVLEGKTIEILDGDAAGDRRNIFLNDTTTLTPQADFSADVTGASYRIFEPHPGNRIIPPSGVPMVVGTGMDRTSPYGSPAPQLLADGSDDFGGGLSITNAIIVTGLPFVGPVDARLSFLGCELVRASAQVAIQGTGQLLLGRGTGWNRVTPPATQSLLSPTSWVGWGINSTSGFPLLVTAASPFIGGFVNHNGYWRQQTGVAHITGHIRGYLRVLKGGAQEITPPVMQFGRLAPFVSPKLCVGRVTSSDLNYPAIEVSNHAWVELGDEFGIESTTRDCIHVLGLATLTFTLDINLIGTCGGDGVVVRGGGRLLKNFSGSFDIQGSLTGDEYKVGNRPVSGGGGTLNDAVGTTQWASITGSRPEWDTGVAVTTHAVTLSHPGHVIAVEATTATSAGPKALQFSATPAAGFVRVEYDALGIATLTFNTADAVTEAAILLQIEDDGSAIINLGSLFVP